ncbi:retrovirus-related pol polyprotein from transposon TNT 1-94 [Tanacetum coccineum]
MEAIHVTFDELTVLASKQFSSGHGFQFMTPTTSSSGLVPNLVSQQPCHPPNIDEWDRLFQPMFDEFFNPSPCAISLVPVAAAPRAIDLADSFVSTSIDQDASSTSIPSTQEKDQSLIISQGVKESPKTPHFNDDPFHETLHEDSTSQGSSSNVRPSHSPFELLGRWTKNHPIEIIEAVRIFVANAAYRNMTIYQMDIKTALLNGELKEEVYVSQPEGFVAQDNASLCLCAQYQANPTEKHLQAIKRIFRYLRGTIHMGLWYSKNTGMSLTAYSDADHAGCQDTRLSTSGITNYGFQFNKIPLYYDNKSAIALCCNNVQHSRAKHIDVRYYFLKEQVENGIVELYFFRTEYQLANIFTKPLPRERFKFLIEKHGMRSMSPETLKRLAEEDDE